MSSEVDDPSEAEVCGDPLNDGLDDDTTALPAADLAEAVMPNFANVLRDVVAPDYSKVVAEAVMPNFANVLRDVVAPDYSKVVAEAVMPNFANVLRDVVHAPDFAATLRNVVLAPRAVDTILASFARRHTVSAAGYVVASEELFERLGIEKVPELANVTVGATSDDSAYRAIAAVSPETAAAIERASRVAGNPLLRPEIIRNMLAWLVMSLIVTAYVGGTFLFPPWGLLAVALLSSTGVTAPAAYKRIVGTPRE